MINQPVFWSSFGYDRAMLLDEGDIFVKYRH